MKTLGFITTDGTNLFASGTGTDNNQHIFSVSVSSGATSILWPAGNPLQLAIAETSVFWIDPNSGPVTDTQILTAPAYGGGSVSAIYTGSSVGQPIVDGSGLVADLNFLYAADEVAGTVWRLKFDGSALTELGPSRYSGGFPPEHLNTIAVSQGIIYVADQGKSAYSVPPAVLSISTNGSSFTTLVSGSPLVSPSGIAVGNGVIYVSDPGAGNTIWEVPLTGGTPQVLVSGAPFNQIEGLCFLRGNLYVADTGAGAIYRVTLTEPVLQAATYIGAAGADMTGTGIRSFGNAVYICANNSTSSGALARFNTPLANGASPTWQATWPDTNPSDQFNGLTATSNGLYAAGPDFTRTTDTVGGKEGKGLVLKFPFTGATGGGFDGDIWDQQTPAAPGAFAYGGSEGLNAITVSTESGTNFLYVTGAGQHDGANGGRLYISKVDESGNVLWTQTDGAEIVGEAYSSGEAVTALNSNIFVAGLNCDTNSNGQPYLRKYSPSGSFAWRRNDNFVGVYFGITAVPGETNYLYAVGYKGTNTGPSANLDFLIEKWDENGNQIWSRTYDRNGAQDILSGIINFSGRLFAVGSTRGQTAGGSDAVLMEFDPGSGNLLSTTLYGGALDDSAAGIHTDGTNLFVVGSTRSFGNGSNQVMVLSYALSPTLVRLTVNPANAYIKTGSNLQFTATGYYSDGSSLALTNPGVAWTSSVPSVASINTNGLASGLAQGSTVITATDSGISSNAILNVVVVPTISTNPVSTTAVTGGSVNLAISANGGGLSYQWQLNGTNISGANGPTLAINNIGPGNIGVYTCIVSNAAGMITSKAATVASVDLHFLAAVYLDGPIGSNYLIQATANLASNWTSLTNITLPAQPYIFIDYGSLTNQFQFYRAVPQ